MDQLNTTGSLRLRQSAAGGRAVPAARLSGESHSSTTPPTQPATETVAAQARDQRTVILSSFVGSSIEYYDFLLYSQQASLVFSSVFFSNTSGPVGLILSFSTLAVGYLIRPLGGVVFGHFGDRMGRRRMLLITMSIMGAASALIGCVPSYASIGVAAPIILIVLRLLQGVAVGGDFGGSVSLGLESAPNGRRGFMAAFSLMGAPAGATIAAVVMALFGYMDHDAFLAWGWRLPFLFGGLLCLVGLRVRMRMIESPLFAELQEQGDVRKRASLPIVVVLRERWLGLVVAVLGTMSVLALQGLMPTYVLNLATETGGHSRSAALWAFSIGSVLQVVVAMLSGRLSDRFGRNRIMLIGLAIGLVVSYPVLWSATQASAPVMLVGMVVGLAAIAVVLGPGAAFISERFDTAQRYTGSSLGYQISTTLGSGFGPLIAASLAAAGGYHLVAVYILACFVVGLLVVGIAARTRFV